MQRLFIIIETILIIAAAPPYIIDTLKRKTKPERATWLILSVLSVIGFIAELKVGVNWGLVFLGLDAATSITVFALSIPFGVGGSTPLDRYALAIASLGVIVALVVDKPIVALFGTILADIAGTSLTIRKAYLEPSTETTISWLLVGVAACFSVLAIGKIEFALLVWPVYLAVANLAVPAAQGIGRLSDKV